MNNIEFQNNTPLPSNNISKQGPAIIVAKVTTCLTSHDLCTGRYSDFSCKYAINCDCTCHRKTRDKMKKHAEIEETEMALAEVEGPETNAIHVSLPLDLSDMDESK